MCYRADYCLYSKVNRNETTDIVNPVFRRTPLEHVVPRDTLYVEERKKGEMDGEEEEEKEEEEEEGGEMEYASKPRSTSVRSGCFYTVYLPYGIQCPGILWLSCCRSRLLLERSFWSRERL